MNSIDLALIFLGQPTKSSGYRRCHLIRRPSGISQAYFVVTVDARRRTCLIGPGARFARQDRRLPAFLDPASQRRDHAPDPVTTTRRIRLLPLFQVHSASLVLILRHAGPGQDAKGAPVAFVAVIPEKKTAVQIKNGGARPPPVFRKSFSETFQDLRTSQ